MDCNHARLLLGFTHKKAELDTAEAEALQAHLEQCPECELMARSERAIDDALGRAMNDVPVPAGLKERLVDKLASVQRARFLRGPGPWAAAAALLLAVGYVVFFAPPKLTWADVERWTQDKEMAVSEVSDHQPERIEGWFRDQGIDMEAPRHFNFGLLKSFDIVDFKNRRVAKLVFARDDAGQVAIAEVYVLSEKDFNLTALKDDLKKEKELRLTGSRFTAQISPSSGDFIFLVIFQGPLLDPFLMNLPSA
jgi:hypothetical protein